MTTKEQERKALEQIRKIVEELGEGSYVATAFEGCFEIAEENIKNDWGCNMKQEVEAAEKKAQMFSDSADSFREELIRTQQERNTLREQVAELQGKALTQDDLESVIDLAAQRRLDLDAKVNEFAAKIVETADKPESEEFKEAVRRHRNAAVGMKSYEELIQRLISKEQ